MRSLVRVPGLNEGSILNATLLCMSQFNMDWIQSNLFRPPIVRQDNTKTMNHCHRRRSNNILSRIIATVQVLLLLLPVVAKERHRIEVRNSRKPVHRVFPAAKSESYNPNNLPPTLGVHSRSDDISFVTSFSSAVDDAGETNKILDPAFARFRNSLRNYPDFRDDYPVNPTGLHQMLGVNYFSVSERKKEISEAGEEEPLYNVYCDTTIVLLY